MNKDYLKELKDPRWQKKRLLIMQRDNFSCQYCGCKDKELQIHHKFYEKDKKPWEYDDSCLITLCQECHENETNENLMGYSIYKSLKKTFCNNDLSISMLNSILLYFEKYVDGDFKNEKKDEMIKSIETLLKNSCEASFNNTDKMSLLKYGIEANF